MKIGDYVRTKDGIIGKLQQKDYTYDKKWIIDTLWYDFDEIVDKWTCGVMEWNIIKSSPNIIDLIEVGDYVNGNLVSYIGSDCIEIYWYKDEMQWLELKEIKSIVTKEQFERCEYKI